MKKSKGMQLVDKSYSRRSHYGKELDQWSLGAAIKSVKALSKLGTTGGGSKGQTKAHRTVHKAPKPTLSPNAEGITPLLPIFDGKKSFVCWLSQVENYFRGKYFSDLKKYELVVSCLKGFALLWFTSLKLSRTMKGKSLIRSWSKLEHHMKREYLPSYDLIELSDRLRKEKQKLLHLVGNVKPYTTPPPDLVPKFENAEVCPEFDHHTNMNVTCLYDELDCEKDECTLKSGILTLDGCETLEAKKNDSNVKSHALTCESLRSPATSLTTPHCETKDTKTYLTPLENQSQVSNQQTTTFTTTFPEKMTKQEPKEDSYILQPQSQLLPEFPTLRSKEPSFFTPHFNYPMLIWLKKSLIQLGSCIPPFTPEMSDLSLREQTLMWPTKIPPDECSKNPTDLAYCHLTLPTWAVDECQKPEEHLGLKQPEYQHYAIPCSKTAYMSLLIQRKVMEETIRRGVSAEWQPVPAEIPRHFFLIFDPGGRRSKTISGIKI